MSGLPGSGPASPTPPGQPPRPANNPVVFRPAAAGPRPANAPLGSPSRPAISQNLAPKPRPKMQMIVQGDVAIVTILESRILDESNIAAIGRELMDLVTKQYRVKMVIDLSEVKYLSSAVLRQFIAVYKAIKAEKGDLKLCRVDPSVREVFKITQLDKMIEIKDDLESAINSFKKAGGWGFLQR